MTTVFHLDLPRLRARAWWVVFGCWVTAALSLVAWAAQWIALSAGAAARSQWLDWLIGDSFFFVVTAAYMATAVMWLVWLYRAVANVRASAAPALIWSPTAAIVWSLIPLVSIVMQFFIVRAIWQVSFRRSDSAPPLVTLWALSVVLPAAVTLVPMFHTGDLAAFDLRAEAAANGLQALSMLLQAALVRQLTRAQASLRPMSDTFS